MKTQILSVIILCLTTVSILAQNDNAKGWQWQYPKPQGNTLRDIYVFNKNTAVAVGDLGTVIKTTDGGNNWDVQHHAGGTDIDLYGVNFTDEMNGWACGGIWWMGKSVLLKTTDGGKNWSQVTVDMKSQIDTTLPLSAVYFVDNNTGIAVGEDGVVIRTTDGGSSWDVRKMDAYIGAYLDIFRLNAITFTDKNTGYIVGLGYYGNEIYKTTDGGMTWQWDEQSIIPKLFGSLNDVSFIDKNHGYIVGEYDVFLSTTDGGNTWQQDTAASNGYSVSFTDSLTGWSTGDGYILGTTDGGKNWARSNSGQITGEVLFKVRFTDKNNGWFIGGEGIIYRTTDGGSSWISQREKIYSFNSIYFVDENTGWAVGDSGIILHTSDGGNNWIKQIQNDSLVLSSVYAIDENNAFTVGSLIKGPSIADRSGIILKTTNNGQTWAEQTFDSLYGFNSITFVKDSIGWVVAGLGLLQTTNKGATWYKIPIDSNLPTYNLQFINKQCGWGTKYNDRYILKTINGGWNWEAKLVDPDISISSFHFFNEDIGWVIGGSNSKDKIIFYTTDGGNNWMKREYILGYFAYYFSTINFIDENIGWSAGSKQYASLWSSTIIKTTNGGKNWLEQNAPNTVGISNIFPINEKVCYATGYNGIFKTNDGGGIVGVGKNNYNKNIIPSQLELYQNYPNPFNPSTTIEYKLTKKEYVTLQIFNILGQKVEQLIEGEQNSGSHKIIWNPKGICSGIYFYRLQAGNYLETKKMILLQ